MIRRSDNGAASRVRDIVGNGALGQLARRARMRRFATARSWGATRISTADQTRLFLRMDRFVVRRHRATALALLGSITRSQRWGIARARPPGWNLYFKGGWGDGDGEVDHQIALLTRDGRRVAVGIMTTANPSKAYGDRTLRGGGAAAAARAGAGLGAALTGRARPAARRLECPPGGPDALSQRAGLPRRGARLAGREPSRRGTARRRRQLRLPQAVAAQAARAGLRRPVLARGVRRPRRHADRAGHLRRGAGAGQGPRPRQRARAWSWAARW